MKRIVMGCAFLLLVAVDRVLVAQGTSFGAAGVAATANGENLSSIETGLGGDLTLRAPGQRWTIGGGVQFMTHAVSGSDDDLTNFALLVEPRYVLRERGDDAFGPYALARGTFIWSKIGAGDQSRRRTGKMLGFGLGALYRFHGNIDLDLSVSWSLLWYGNEGFNGLIRKDSDAQGSSLGVRLGLLIGT